MPYPPTIMANASSRAGMVDAIPTSVGHLPRSARKSTATIAAIELKDALDANASQKVSPLAHAKK